MTGFAWLLLIVGIGIAGADLWSVAERRRDIEQYAKAGATVVIALSLAVAGDALPGRWWIVLGLLGAAGGDYLIYLNRFVDGVLAFVVAQVALLIGLAQRDTELVAAAIGLAVVIVFLMEFGMPIMAAAAQQKAAVNRAVILYLIAIGSLVGMGFATTSPMAAVGAATFAASDSLVAWRRLVEPAPWMPLVSRILYRVALVALVLAFT